MRTGKIPSNRLVIFVIAAYLFYGVASREIFDDRWVLLVVSAFCFYVTVRGISTGATFGKFGRTYTRSEHPILFCYFVALTGVVSIACLLVAAGLIPW